MRDETSRAADEPIVHSRLPHIADHWRQMEHIIVRCFAAITAKHVSVPVPQDR
jgi:hypothetical protein